MGAYTAKLGTQTQQFKATVVEATLRKFIPAGDQLLVVALGLLYCS